MSFRVCESFLHILWVVQIVHVLHMFHTSRPRCTIRDFCLHTKRFEIRLFVLAQFASCPYYEHLIFLIPWMRFGHFIPVVTKHYPFVSLARSIFSCGTFLMFQAFLFAASSFFTFLASTQSGASWSGPRDILFKLVAYMPSVVCCSSS